MADKTCEHKLSERDHGNLERPNKKQGVKGDSRRRDVNYRPESWSEALEDFEMIFGPCLICDPSAVPRF